MAASEVGPTPVGLSPMIDSATRARALPKRVYIRIATPPIRRLDLTAPPGQIEVWLPIVRRSMRATP